MPFCQGRRLKHSGQPRKAAPPWSPHRVPCPWLHGRTPPFAATGTPRSRREARRSETTKSLPLTPEHECRDLRASPGPPSSTVYLPAGNRLSRCGTTRGPAVPGSPRARPDPSPQLPGRARRPPAAQAAPHPLGPAQPLT